MVTDWCQACGAGLVETGRRPVDGGEAAIMCCPACGAAIDLCAGCGTELETDNTGGSEHCVTRCMLPPVPADLTILTGAVRKTTRGPDLRCTRADWRRVPGHLRLRHRLPYRRRPVDAVGVDHPTLAPVADRIRWAVLLSWGRMGRGL